MSESAFCPSGLASHLSQDQTSSLVGVNLPATKHWPWVEVISQAPDQFELEMIINPELKWFIGHFVDQPVLPGVVQTHWAGLLALELFCQNAALHFKQLHKLKFNSVVTPGQHLKLTLTWRPDRQQCSFNYVNSDIQPVSSGVIHFDSAQST